MIHVHALVILAPSQRCGFSGLGVKLPDEMPVQLSRRVSGLKRWGFRW